MTYIIFQELKPLIAPSLTGNSTKRVSGIGLHFPKDYNLHNPQTLNPIPPMAMMEAWKEDYKKMQKEMIYEESAPSFEELINTLNQIKEKLRALEWEFNMEFPLPND
ncbi:MAG: hypothetical protein U0X91_03070 [Spirosomataceae bacterium]